MSLLKVTQLSEHPMYLYMFCCMPAAALLIGDKQIQTLLNGIVGVANL